MEVRIKSHFDGLAFAELINWINPEIGRGILIGKDLVSAGDNSATRWMAQYIQEDQISTLISSTDSPATTFSLPFAYSYLVSTFLGAMLTKESTELPVIEFPPLLLDIAFRDRAARRHRVHYTIMFEFQYLLTKPVQPWEKIGAAMLVARAT